MSLVGISNPRDTDESPGPDTLGDVSLKFFRAQPTAIGPFGAATLSWSVTGPPNFHVKLNGRDVPKTGNQIVQPTSTSSYRLTAHAQQASRTLGNVQVTVDRSTCQTFDLANPQSAMASAIRAQIKNTEDLYVRPWNPMNPSGPDILVTFSPGRIRLRMKLGKRLNNRPDPTVHIDASFGLAVREGVVEAIAEQVSVDVTVPAWVWLIPTIALGLAIALAMAKDNAIKKVHEMIDGMAQLLGFLGSAPPGTRLSTVRIDDGNNGAGVVEFTACSTSLLTKLAELSETVFTPIQPQ